MELNISVVAAATSGLKSQGKSVWREKIIKGFILMSEIRRLKFSWLKVERLALKDWERVEAARGWILGDRQGGRGVTEYSSS